MVESIVVPPGPRLLPFVGVGMAFQRDMLGFLCDAAQRWGGVVRLGTLGPTPAFLVSDPELVGQVLQLRWRDFVRDDVVQAAGSPVFGRGLLFAEGELWLMLRRTMQPAFTRERLAQLVPKIQAEIQQRSDGWAQATASDQPLPMAVEMARLTQSVFVRAMFGTSLGPHLDPLLEAWTVVNEYVTQRILSPVRLPARWPTPANRRMRRAVRVLDAIVGALVVERREALAQGHERDDLLGMFLAARDPETGEGLDEALLRDQILMTFFAGFETTSTALTWVWILLARHPDVERRLHAELDAVLGGRPPTAEDLPRLCYMQQVLDETLRLYPSVFMLARQPMADQVLGGYTIRAGSVVFVSPWVLHHDPSRWPDPERFDPERFAPAGPHGGTEHDRARFGYIPFGAGPRLCIGKHLALMEAKLVLATVAQRYAPRTLAGVEYRSRPLFTLHVGGGAPMRLCPR
jgi:cytochrome P450